MSLSVDVMNPHNLWDDVTTFHMRQQKYNEWMSSEELRALTASEPLTLEEEFEMQEKWQVDEDKLTFIILSREGRDLEFGSLGSAGQDANVIQPLDIDPTDERLTQCPMVGDVNLFLSGTKEALRRIVPPPRDGDEEGDDGDDAHAEVEIMIAEPEYRRKGYAMEALQLMLAYATGKHLGPSPHPSSQPIQSPLQISPTRLLTRISETNVPSMGLFERLGFKITKRIAVFQEVEMRWQGLQTTSS